MKVRIVIILFVILGIINIYGAIIEYSQLVDYPEINERGEYLDLKFEGFHLLGEEGHPGMPWFGWNYLLPQNEKIKTITIGNLEYYSEIVTGNLSPMGRAFPISQPAPADYKPLPDKKIYQCDAVFPGSCIGKYNTGYLCGHSIGSFRFCPVEYNPVKESLRFIKQIDFIIETEVVKDQIGLGKNLRTSKKIEERIERIVKNPEYLASYIYPSRERTEEYDLLIITSDRFDENWAEYYDYKTSLGYKTSIVFAEDIYDLYPGVDEAEKVRNCIIDNYQNYGIEYVLLGGDAGNMNEEAIVPHRNMNYDLIPSDIYFTNLDGTWYDEGNEYWGTIYVMDYYSEVSVGRWCIDSEEELENMITKHINYQDDPYILDICKGLMVGEQLDNYTWGGDYKNEIAEGGYYNGYESAGFPESYNITTLYEIEGGYDKYDIFAEFSESGAHLLNHLGHSNPTYNMKVYNEDITGENFSNNGIDKGLVVGYSQGCYNGSFDNYHFNGYYTEDCFAEKMTGGISGGEVACISNSRFGYYWGGGTDGCSQYFDRMFFDGLFGENITNIGDINSYSHEADISVLDEHVYRKILYATNLFGDPSLDIWTDIPDVINAILPESVEFGAETITIETNVAGARIAVMGENGLLGRGFTGYDGNTTMELDEQINILSDLQVSITGHNYLRFYGEIAVVTQTACVVCQGYAINDENGNGLADYGETISLDLELYNGGETSISDCVLALCSISSGVTILDGTADIENIEALETVELEQAVSFEISDDVEDHQQLEFIITISCGDEEWDSELTITANAPELEYVEMEIDDSEEGNNNGRLEPNENADLIISIKNSGNCNSPAGNSWLTSLNPEIIFFNNEIELPEILPDNTTDQIFHIFASGGIEEGTEIDIGLYCEAGNYELEEEMQVTVGIYGDDFETGDFSLFDWQFPGDIVWEIDTLACEGEYSAVSGESEQSTYHSILRLEYYALFDDEISFACKISCDRFEDHFNFEIDNISVWEMTGEVDWVVLSFPVLQGYHVFAWDYWKCSDEIVGENRVWLDNIVFPAFGYPEAPELNVDVDEIQLIAVEGDSASAVFSITNLGEENLEWNTSKYYISSRDWGGTDEYGYMWMDSNEYGEIEFDWIDISTTGTEINFENNDTGTELIPAGFTFNFYGTDYEEFRINPNGWIGFGDDNEEWSNTSLPNRNAPRPAVMPLWDDLYPEDENGGGGDVFYQSFDDYLVVMFNNVIHFPGNYEGTYDFEVIIFEDGRIKIQYNAVDGDINTCTIGIQKDDFSDALQIVYNQNYLEDGLAVEIKKIDDWLEITPCYGTVTDYETQSIQIKVVSGDLEIGEYNCDLIIHTNDPEQEEYILPVEFIIEETISDESEITSINKLYYNYPNPFNPSTYFSFNVSEDDTPVKLSVYNIKGQLVEVVTDKVFNSGSQVIEWNASRKASGIYFYKCEIGDYYTVRKMLLLK